MRIALPLTPPALALLCAAWLLPGLIGHSPWKSDDAIGIGVVHQLLRHGDWMLPRLAGEFFPDDGPLFYWFGASVAKLLSWLLATHDAVRIAGGACILAALVFLRQAGRAFDEYNRRDADNRNNDNGQRRGDAVMLVFIGSVGLLMHAHEAVAESMLLAGLACAYFGAALVPTRPVAAGIAIGCGLGTAFLSNGIVPVLPVIAALLVTPLFVRDWRDRNAGIALVFTLTAALPWFLLWPWLLHARSPDLFQAWLQKANLVGLAHGFSAATAGYSLQTLAWFAFPAWPIALWALWLNRRKPASAAIIVPFAALLVALVMAGLAREQKELPLLPLLLPLSLLAGQVAGDLRRGAANLLAWFGAMTFSILGFLVWLGYSALQTGIPPRIAANAARLEPGFVSHFAFVPFVLAVLLTLGWLALILRSAPSPYRGATIWAAGLALFWGLAMLLWLPWIDYGKTYAPVALSIRAQLPVARTCITSRGLGEAQRAAFDYHAGIVTQRIEQHRGHDCRVLLVQANAREPEDVPGKRWTKTWEGSRPGDRSEKYRLYVRQ